VYCASTDPTPGELLRQGFPNLMAWVERMLEPKAEGEFEPWDALAPTLNPLLRTQVGALFLPWSDANAKAIAAGSEEFTVKLESGSWTQKPQKYHAKSLAALRRKYSEVSGESALRAVLSEADCLRWLDGEA
jgi:hypothetical protein